MRIVRSFFALVALTCSTERPAIADTIDKAKTADVRMMIGKSPDEVSAQFGKPTETLRFLPRYVVSDKYDVSLLQTYDFYLGGRVAFLFADNVVVGIIFDRMSATKSPAIADFFRSEDPRQGLMVECVQNDAAHALAGHPAPLQTIAAQWATPDGGTFYARLRADGDLPERYDSDLAKNVVDFPRDLNRYALLQLGYFPLAGGTTLTDLHLSDAIPNTSFSTVFDPAHQACAD
jgi:hypothetical protein